MNADPKKGRASLLLSSLSCFVSSGVLLVIFGQQGLSGAFGIATLVFGVTSLVLAVVLIAIWYKRGSS